jgi:ABC-type glycerol-3-phosphate transport system substrate-binding protein
MRRAVAAWLLALCASGCGAGSAAVAPADTPAGDVTLTVAATNTPAAAAALTPAARRYHAASAVGVRFVASRDLARDQERFATQYLVARDKTIDVFEVPTDAARRLAVHTLDLSVHLPGAPDGAVTAGGRTVALHRPGGQALVVSAYSRHPAQAADLVAFLADDQGRP